MITFKVFLIKEHSETEQKGAQHSKPYYFVNEEAEDQEFWVTDWRHKAG